MRFSEKNTNYRERWEGRGVGDGRRRVGEGRRGRDGRVGWWGMGEGSWGRGEEGERDDFVR